MGCLKGPQKPTVACLNPLGVIIKGDSHQTFRWRQLELPGCFALASLLWPFMGRTAYLPIWMVDFDGFHVGKYTSSIEGMGYGWLMCRFFVSPPEICQSLPPTNPGLFISLAKAWRASERLNVGSGMVRSYLEVTGIDGSEIRLTTRDV